MGVSGRLWRPLLVAIGVTFVLYWGLTSHAGIRERGLRYFTGAGEEVSASARLPRPLVHITPQARFRDNLRNDTKYLTTWQASGYTNDFYSITSLIFLAIMTDRVPVLPAFSPSHVDHSAGPIRVSQVFDIPRLEAHLGIPILEWDEVKDLNVPIEEMIDEELGCWSVTQALFQREEHVATEDQLKVDVSYWPLLDTFRVVHEYPNNTPQINLFALGSLQTPEWREKAMARIPRPATPTRRSGRVVDPDEHMMCFDYLFFSATWSQEHLEMYEQYSPPWNMVGQYMYNEPDMEELGRQMLHRALGIPDNVDTPPFVGVHIRHGDFSGWCPKGLAKWECFAPLTDYDAKIKEVQAELRSQGVIADHVLVASDEQNAKWWSNVAGYGWSYVNHTAERTEELYGKWYPVLLDQAILSLSTGFVKTDRSTYSLVCEKRALAWHPIAASRMVRWGEAHANGI